MHDSIASNQLNTIEDSAPIVVLPEEEQASQVVAQPVVASDAGSSLNIKAPPEQIHDFTGNFMGRINNLATSDQENIIGACDDLLGASEHSTLMLQERRVTNLYQVLLPILAVSSALVFLYAILGWRYELDDSVYGLTR